MKRLLTFVLIWFVVAILAAEARFTHGFWSTPSAPVLPFQGFGDILTNVIVYHSAYGCYTNNGVNVPVAIVKNLANTSISTTLGCNGPLGVSSGTPIPVAGSGLGTTCASTCYVDTLYDQSSGKNCSSAACNLTQTQNTTGRGNVQNPQFVANCAPNGTSYCMHFTGWADGASGSTGGIASGTYNNSTGVVVLSTTPIVYYVPGDSINIFNLNAGSTALAGNWVVTGVTAHTITYNAGAGLGASPITSGSYRPNPQTLNNDVGTFAQVNEPYSVATMLTCDGYQNAGSSGGPNSSHTQNDSTIEVGCQTTPIGNSNGSATIDMGNGNTLVTACASGCTINYSVSYGQWYSILAVFDNSHTVNGKPNSWLCINGSCNQVDLGGSVNWATGAAFNDGYSIGNGSGGWGGSLTYAAMMTGDKHVMANVIHTLDNTLYGNF